MVAAVLSVLATLTAFLPAEMPAELGYQGGRGTNPSSINPPIANPAPAWQRLEAMSPAERANAVIQLERSGEEARLIEALWNSRRCDEALARLRQLDPGEIGVCWREPVPAPETDWGQPIQVSTRDSILEVKLDADTVTGNLFCALRYMSGTGYYWSINISTNGGTTWAETYEWFASYLIPSISLVVVAGHAFVGYCRTGADQVAMRRFLATNGTSVNFPSGGAFFTIGTTTSPDTIMEIALASNADPGNNRIYAFYNTRSNLSRVVGFATDDFDTFDFNNEPAEVEKGLDVEWNYYPSGHPLVFSFVNPAGNVRVYGYDASSAIDTLYNGGQLSNGPYTALAAWKDTVLVVFDQQRTTVTQTRYLVQYGAGSAWYQGGIGDTTTGFSQMAAATGRRGDGIAVTYWQAPQNPGGQSYRWRGYYTGWTTPVNIQGTLNTYSIRVPAIERIADGIFGVVFYRGVTNGIAYFNRSDWTGIAEPRPGLPVAGRMAASIVCGAIELKGAAAGVLRDASGRKVSNLRAGLNDLSGIAPGVYFVEPGSASAGYRVILAR